MCATSLPSWRLACFTKQKFLLGEEFSMLDVAIAPLLWRLITTASNCRSAAPLMKYAERIFCRRVSSTR